MEAPSSQGERDMQASEVCHTVKVKPWGKGQGEFVEINADDFDPDIHELAKGEAAPVEAPAPDPLDHDGDGHSGGSAKGAASTARKGAAKRKGKK
jgi:hypothetical protein